MRKLNLLLHAWIIVVGIWIITPDGVFCIACAPTVNKVLGALSIALGAIGLIMSLRGNRISV